MFGSGFGVDVQSDATGVLFALRGWRPWMVFAVLGLLLLVGVLVGFNLGRRVGRVEQRARARVDKRVTSAP